MINFLKRNRYYGPTGKYKLMRKHIIWNLRLKGKGSKQNHKGLGEVRNEVTKATSDVAKNLATIEWETPSKRQFLK